MNKIVRLAGAAAIASAMVLPAKATDITVGLITSMTGPGASIGIPYAKGAAAGVVYKDDVNGIKVKKGKLYWVVLSPQKKFRDTYDVWNNNFQGLQGTFSNNIGSGWNSSYQVLGAFGVFGK